ncbi:hypothetical protein K2173_023925 [Erythroxylum novogranatense]|uniref:Bifunctional inhibitor/plant lipid transfer protein/seed storage helical domain-containing protein n=1 Tax=Erythroxylum novogranatense TaxID=1862640 RepID=A0AAV8TSL9_9ROSI|nr:hypothetical protein K2173_023925 [Erythroxylum novogranatense]
MKGFWAILSLVLVVSAAIPTEAGPAICKQVKQRIQPCQKYLSGNASKPSPNCCAVVQELKDRATDKLAKKVVCQCLEDASELNIQAAKIKKLPGLCNVDVEIPYASNSRCSKKFQ